MATTNQRIRYDLEAAVSGEQDVAALARQLEGLADTLEGDLKTQALASASALRELGAKQGAIDNFVKLKGEAGAAAARLKEAQTAAQQLGQSLAATSTPTRAQAGQMEKLRDAVRSAKTELQAKTQALDNSRATLNAYGVSSTNVAQAERTTRVATGQVRDEVAKLAPAYTAAGKAAAASGLKQTQTAQAVKASFSGIGDSLRTIQSIALTAVGGTFLTSMARDVAQVADQYANLQARLKLVTGDGPALEAAFEGVRRVALATNSDLEGTVNLFARISKAGKDLGLSQEQALSLTQTINQAIQISGGSAESANAAIIQLVQGLQSGVLRGEEFNSVMEQAPGLAQALADGLGVTTGELRAMAQQGRLTTEVVLTALRDQGAAVQAQFDQLPATVGRALQNLSTKWTVFIGQLDQSAGATTAVAGAINAVAENLDEIAGLATRAGAVMAAALAVQAAGAVRAYLAEVTLATAGTKLLALQMSALPKTLQIAVAFTGFEVGYQIGQMLNDNSEAARKLGVATVAFIQGNIEVLRLLKDSAAAVFTDDTMEAAYARFKVRLGETKATLEQMWEDAAQAPGPAAKAADAVADATASVGTAAEDAARKIRISGADMVEAWEAAAIAKRGDAQAAEANLQVQLQLARQSEDLARFMGNENGIRQAKIQQMQIEIQIAQARVGVMRAEAEGSISVAQAKLAEMQASGNVSLVKQAELENTIKLARAKLAEADATGKATELMQRQLDQFKNGTAGADGYGNSLDRLTGKQGRLAAATRDATAALERQLEVNRRYSRPGEMSTQSGNEQNYDPGRNMYSRPGDDPVNGNGQTQAEFQRAQRLAGQNAVDNSLQFTLRDKLAAGELTAADVDDLRAVVDALRQREQVDRDVDRMSPGAFSLEGMRDRRSWEQTRLQFEAAISRLGGGAGAGVGRNVAITLKTGRGDETINTDEAGAAALVRGLQSAGLSAKG